MVNQEVTKSNEAQPTGLNTPQNSEQGTSRRNLISGLAGTSAVVLSLANRPALASSCSMSGFMSVNPSLDINAPSSCDAWSPGAWKNAWLKRNSNSNGGGDLSINSADGWGTAQVSGITTLRSLFTGTLQRIDGANPESYTCSNNGTFIQALEGTNDITKHASAALLNALFVQKYLGADKLSWMQSYISPADVISSYLLYDATATGAFNGAPLQYVTSSGTVVKSTDMTEEDYLKFFKMLASHDNEWEWDQ